MRPQKPAFPIFYSILLLSVIIAGCKKDDGGVSVYPYHLNVTIGSVKYATNSVASFGLSNELGCVANKSFEVTNAGQIYSSDYFIDCYFKHYTYNKDFSNTRPSSHKIFDGGDLLKNNQCNCDLIIGLIDNSISSNLYATTILQTANVSHNVTKILKVDTSGNSITYSVSGSFSCYFKNINNVLIPVSGDYVLPITELK
ncbi:hypothetical protein ACI6Q2_23125 [Chitinophagaceae bacterium LWZ2-11]